MSDHHQFKRIPLIELAMQARGHSIFSPSGSSMWAYCSGSLIPNIQMPDSAGIEAAAGKVAHGIGELWLKTGVRPSHLIGTTERIYSGEGDDLQIFDILIDEDMLYYVGLYVDWCKDLPGVHQVEVRVDFSDLTPILDQGGTSDHIALQLKKLICTDLKFGVGVKVYAENNTQAILYNYGTFLEWDDIYDFQEIVIRICQPRLDHFDEWTITREELLQWAAWLKVRAHLAWQYDAPRTPGNKQCQWCKIKTSCKAFATWIESMSDGAFDDLDAEIDNDAMEATVNRLDKGDKYLLNPVATHELTTAQKAAIYRHKSLIVTWLTDIGKELYQELQNGESVPLFKLVKGKDARTYRSQSEAVEHFEDLGLSIDDIMPREIRSPAKMEETLIGRGFKRKDLGILMPDKLIRRISGKHTMVSTADRREAIIVDDSDAFDDLGDDL